MIDQEITVQPLSRQTAPGVGDLFRTVYGEAYPIKLYYDPEELMATVARRELFEVVAITAEGRVVGVGNMFHTAPNPDIYETGGGLVHPDFRRLNLFNRMFEYICEVTVPQEGMGLIHGESVCNHVFTQKLQAWLGFVDTALEVALMPVDTYAKEKNTEGRVSTIINVRTYKPAPHRVHLPERYAAALERIYQNLDDERDLVPARGKLAAASKTELNSFYWDTAGVLQMNLPKLGQDLAERLEAEEAAGLAKDAKILLARLPLDEPGLNQAVEELRSRGYFLGGVLPRWFGKDALLMQRLLTEPNWEGIKLLGERQQTIHDLVFADWQALSRG